MKIYKKYLLIICCQIIILFFFIYKTDLYEILGFPLDDAWIHQSIARNLGEHFELSFNHGELTTGSTSLLWTVILALNFAFFKVNPVYYTLAINILLYFLTGFFLYKLLKEEIDELTTCIIAILFSITGNVLFFVFSGMEVFLFYFLSIASIYFFSEKKYIITGLFCGFLALTRPEGLGLFIILTIIGIYNLINKKEEKGIIFLIILPAIFFGISASINYYISGSFLQSTFIGRRWLYELHDKSFYLDLNRAWAFICAWYFRIKQYTFGIKESGSPLKNLFINGKNYLLFFFLLIGFLGIIKDGLFSKVSKKKGGIFLLFIWSLGLNLLYIIFLPALGHAGRYQPLNYLLLSLCMILGAKYTIEWFIKKQKIHTVAMSLVSLILTFVFLNNSLVWSDITKVSIFHINNTHREMALYLKKYIPADEKVAAFDIGAIKYFSNHNIVDLGGLIDRNFIPYLLSGNPVPYLKSKGVNYIVLPYLFSEKTEIGWRLGFFKDSSKIKLIKLKEFGTSKEAWKSGIDALYHADPKQVLLEIRYL